MEPQGQALELSAGAVNLVFPETAYAMDFQSRKFSKGQDFRDEPGGSEVKIPSPRSWCLRIY